jgi:hypothetical protein
MSFLRRTVPWSVGILAFLTGAITAAGVVPVVLPDLSAEMTRFLVVLLGALTIPAGMAAGFGLRDRFLH